MRSIRIIKVGVTGEGRAWARGVVDFEPSEQLAALQIAQQTGARPTPAAFGLVNGLPDEAVAKLKPGDVLQATEATVHCAADKYTDDEGTEVHTIRTRIRVGGKVSRSAAPVATCDW